jgi:diguanylate cyclase (GGDEF)-like protein
MKIRARLSQREWLEQENALLRAELKKLKKELHRDELTGLQNARALKTHLHGALERMRLKNQRPALLFVDIDHFKEVNTANGHEAAGQVLAQVGRVIGSSVRASDLAFRYAGDEFVVLVSGGSRGAWRVAERLRKRVQDHVFEVLGLRGLARVRVTCSIGVRSLKRQDSAARVLEEADRAMFEAKRRSRNCVAEAA